MKDNIFNPRTKLKLGKKRPGVIPSVFKGLRDTVELSIDGELMTKTIQEWIKEKPRALWKEMRSRRDEIRLKKEAYVMLKDRIAAQDAKINEAILRKNQSK